MMNAVTGVATAALDSVPLVAIAGDVPSYYDGRHPHQEVNLHADADQTAIYRPFVKRAWHVHRAEDLPRFTERAFWTATSGRPGAVLLNVPMDIFSRPLPAGRAGRTRCPADAGPPRPARRRRGPDRRRCWSRPSARSSTSAAGCATRPARAALLELAEHLDIPIAHSLMAKGAVPDEHPLLLGMPGFWGLEITNAYAREADVVLALGTRFAETDASSWDPAYTWRFPPSRLIQIDIDPAEIGRNYPVEIGAVADAALAVRGDRRGGQPAPVRRPYPGRNLREHDPAARAGAFAAAREQGRGDAVPAAAGADPGRPAGSAARRRGAGHRRRLEQERRGAVLPAAAPRAGSSPRAGPRPWASARPPRSACRSPSRPGRGGSGRRRRDERAAAGRADGGRAGPAGDLRGDEQPRPRHHRRPAGGELRHAATAASSATRTAARTAPTSPPSAGPAAPTAT